MESTRPQSAAKKLWCIVRVLFYMIRKSVSKQKLMMDLHLLLQRGKLAGKALADLLTFNHHHHHRNPAFSCRSKDLNKSYCNPREVEFSCSNTPSLARKARAHHQKYDAEMVAKAFEILNSANSDAGEDSIAPSPSPAPAMLIKEDGESDGVIDREAEEFIRRFREQLRLQMLVPVTPECRYRRGA